MLRYFTSLAQLAGRLSTSGRLGVLLVLIHLRPVLSSTAQTWQQALTTSASGSVATVRATAADASGNVYVVGSFSGTLNAGATVLASAGATDMFLAKWSAITKTWVWATSGGGAGYDDGYGVAVSGNNVYVTGAFASSRPASLYTPAIGLSTIAGVTFTGAGSSDMFLAKYLDNGASVSNGWAASGGGTIDDYGFGVAVSGNKVYVTGSFISNTGASLAGKALTGAGNSDIYVAKYLDNGASFGNGWVVTGGGKTTDIGYGIALNGNTIYVTGSFDGGYQGGSQVVVAGVALPGVGGDDMFVAKYLDNGPSADDGWAVSGGGPINPSYSYGDIGYGVAVSGSSVYVTGYFGSGVGARIAGATLAGAGLSDLFVAKYNDDGTSVSNGWAISGGGTLEDAGHSVAVRGNHVYVAGNFQSNSSAVVAGTALTGAGDSDILLAHYLDNGSAVTNSGATSGGGAGSDLGYALAVGGSNLYVGGGVGSFNATFGNIPFAGTYGGSLLGQLGDAALPVHNPASAPAGLQVYPSPADGAVTLQGAASGQEIRVLNALGRLVYTTSADARGSATLTLPTGLYSIWADTQHTRLAVK